MVNIAIIGAGQIGSRHLQACALLNQPANIQIVDPSPYSLKTAQERFSQVEKKAPQTSLKVIDSLEKLSSTIDMAIISTSSSVRASVIKQLTAQKDVKNLLLEKVLFQRIKDFEEVSEVLKVNAIPAWVNCYMRSTQFFKKLKESLDYKDKVQMVHEGTNWGLACNAIHYLDAFAYLTSDANLSVVDTQFENDIIDAKRKGFKEFFGKIKLKNAKDDTCELKCYKGKYEPAWTTIHNGAQAHHCEMGDDYVVHLSEEGGFTQKKRYDMPYQSQTTQLHIQSILETRSCLLPTYEESVKVHLPFIQALLDHLNERSEEEVELCPIT